MNLIRCDKCKKEVKSWAAEKISIREKRYKILSDYHIEFSEKDLCEDCYKKLEKWFEED